MTSFLSLFFTFDRARVVIPLLNGSNGRIAFWFHHHHTFLRLQLSTVICHCRLSYLSCFLYYTSCLYHYGCSRAAPSFGRRYVVASFIVVVVVDVLVLVLLSVSQCSALGTERNSLWCFVLLVVSHTAVTAIVALLLLLPLHRQTFIMNELKAISLHEHVARGSNVRRFLNRSGYKILLSFIGSLCIRSSTSSGNDTVEDSDTAAAQAMSRHAKIVLDRMAALNNNVSLIRLLHGRVNARVQSVEADNRPMDEVNAPSESISDLASMPTDYVDAVMHGDVDHDNRTV
jgi:hypothetical protein